jgi:hypothetical protein
MGEDKSGTVQCKGRNSRGQGTARQGKAGANQGDSWDRARKGKGRGKAEATARRN